MSKTSDKRDLESLTGMRRCCSCDEDKPLEEYSRNRTKRLGRGTTCKNCHKDRWGQHFKEYQRKNKEKRRIYMRSYRASLKSLQQDI